MSRRNTMIKQGWILASDTELDMIQEQIRKIPIETVFARYGTEPVRYSGRRILALCPFHMDEHVGSFSMDTEQNTCWCYACNNGGDTIRSMQKIWNKTYVETVLQIACDFNLIDKKTFVRLSGTEYERQGKEITYKMERSKKRPSSETYEMWTNVYEFIRDWFGLLDTDKEELLNKRHLTNDRLKDYFSINTTDPRVVSRLIFDLKSKFPQYVDSIPEIPGFFEVKVKDRYQITTSAVNAIGILLRNASGQVVAIQLRDKDEDTKMRYRYFSYKPSKSNKQMQKGGSVGTPIDVIIPKDADGRVAIVEGRFKAEILAQEGFIALSVQGVSNFSGIEKDIKDIESVLNSFIKDIYVFYDGDQLRNGAVYSAGIKLGNYIKEKSKKTIHYIMWDPNLGKGIDDLIFNGHKYDAKCFSLERYANVYDAALLEAETQSGIKGRSINTIQKEERQKFYDIFEKATKERFGLL